MSSNNSSNSGIGVLGLLGVAFVVLKLTNFIDWSWWYVTMPFWVMFPVILFFGGVYLIYEYLKGKKTRQQLNEIRKPKTENKENKFQRKMREMMEQAEKEKANK